MANDDSDPEVAESTKQVDRELLNKALNQSVESNDVLKRVNALVADDVHAEGTAQVDHGSVQAYLEAARSGEFPAVKQGTGQVDTTAAAEDSDADFHPTRAKGDSVFVSNERDKTGPKAAIFGRSPSRSGVPAPALTHAPDSDATSLDSALGEDGQPIDFSEFTKPETARAKVAPVSTPPSSGTHPAAGTSEAGPRLVIWLLVLAIAGALIGVIIAAIWLVLNSG